MRWAIVGWCIGFGFATSGLSWAQEPGVVTPDELLAAQQNTYHNERWGFSITKPEEWVLYKEEAQLSRDFCGIQVGDSEDVKFAGVVAAVSSFSFDEKWVLLPPTVSVQVYLLPLWAGYTAQDLKPAVQEFVNELLQDIQTDPQTAVQVAFAPRAVEINGNRWTTAGFTGTLPVRTKVAESYVELYMRASGDRLWLVSFWARPVDVPSSRVAVNGIINSLTFD